MQLWVTTVLPWLINQILNHRDCIHSCYPPSIPLPHCINMHVAQSCRSYDFSPCMSSEGWLVTLTSHLPSTNTILAMSLQDREENSYFLCMISWWNTHFASTPFRKAENTRHLLSVDVVASNIYIYSAATEKEQYSYQGHDWTFIVESKRSRTWRQHQVTCTELHSFWAGVS